MSDIFISYARPNEPIAKMLADAMREAGYTVWRDDELPAHRSYSEVIEERLRAAKAVVVIWSDDAARSQWVRAEADAAREAGTLVQLSVDGSTPPLPFNQIQCADLKGWMGDRSAAGWIKVESSVAVLAGRAGDDARDTTAGARADRLAVCVLPFTNMSGDAEQEYFSDGISEDIITDLSKVSALSVIARNTAFSFKGKGIDVKQIAQQLGVSHVLEGSVRKAGGRVRINAQLIDGKYGDHVWADRYDRELDDIFAIQDEISKAIVNALRVQLLPQEKKAIETRGTSSSEAYNLYLMARQQRISGNDGDKRREEVIVRICQQAVTIDPEYAKAWALMAHAQAELRENFDVEVDPLPATEKALQLQPGLAEAHVVKAILHNADGNFDEALSEVDKALESDPENFEANQVKAFLLFRNKQLKEAIPFFDKAASMNDTDYRDAGMLTTCYQAIGDDEGLKRAAGMVQERAEKAFKEDPSNSAALGYGACALAVLGERERAKEWIQRAHMLDPDNMTMQYNLACAEVMYLQDKDAALNILDHVFANCAPSMVTHCDADPDMDPLREDSRYREMIEKARDRLGMTATT
ncbi:TIR domain-containing protein [Sphingomicrobium marinum]|uniref:TIR domain-containing protein n=1 Tax=Sphingomicrobium marinum TaxID=1227950 RepID=UPI0022403FAB|nr:TIR domain-containing protein [Sphingomicrobium marinum]